MSVFDIFNSYKGALHFSLTFLSSLPPPIYVKYVPVVKYLYLITPMILPLSNNLLLESKNSISFLRIVNNRLKKHLKKFQTRA